MIYTEAPDFDADNARRYIMIILDFIITQEASTIAGIMIEKYITFPLQTPEMPVNTNRLS